MFEVTRLLIARGTSFVFENAVAQTTNENANYGGAPEEQVVVQV